VGVLENRVLRNDVKREFGEQGVEE